MVGRDSHESHGHLDGHALPCEDGLLHPDFLDSMLGEIDDFDLAYLIAQQSPQLQGRAPPAMHCPPLPAHVVGEQQLCGRKRVASYDSVAAQYLPSEPPAAAAAPSMPADDKRVCMDAIFGAQVHLADGDDDSLDGEECGDGAKKDRKKTREKKRRLEVNVKFDELTAVLSSMEKSLGIPPAPAKGQGGNRVELLSRTVALMKRLWTERAEHSQELYSLKGMVAELQENAAKAAEGTVGAAAAPAQAAIAASVAPETAAMSPDCAAAIMQAARSMSAGVAGNGMHSGMPMIIAVPMYMPDPKTAAAQPAQAAHKMAWGAGYPQFSNVALPQFAQDILAAKEGEDKVTHAVCA